VQGNPSRREFLVGASRAALGVLAADRLCSANLLASSPEDKLLLSAPLTHSDWMLRPGALWGPEGVRKMLDTCKATGWTRIHWRVFDGGRSLHRSKLMDPQGKWEDDNYHRHHGNLDVLKQVEALDYSQLDTLAEAVSYGHKIGLEIYAWASINEDDHGWGIRSRFAKNHPEYRWRKRNGTLYHSQMSFAFPEVMAYKLALIEELLGDYAIDGLFLDWIRTGDVRDNPQTDSDGVADHGYEQPLVDGFKAKYGVDPHTIANGDERWMRYRAAPHTQFMRSVRKLAKAKRPAGLPISVMVGHPWMYRGDKNKIDGNLRGLLLDVAAWADEGLMDEAVAAGYYLDGGNAERAYQALKAETHGKAPIVYYAWVPGSPGQFENDLKSAKNVGARQMLFWEADFIDGWQPVQREQVQAVMRAHSMVAAPQ
jgi:uncharacterized lipoprotein YddW (UPF0748 family)